MKIDGFSVGWHGVDITPQDPTPLDGMGHDYERQKNWIPANREEDRLKASVIVIADGVSEENTVVLCTMDTLFIHAEFAVPTAEKIAQALNIPGGNVFFCASHTHSGVSMDEPDPSVITYIQWLQPVLVAAAKEAMADLTPARVQIGSLETTGMNAQRRYILLDGSHHSTVGDKTFTSEDIKSFESQPDPTLRAIRFLRQGKEDVLLVNWQIHPGFTGSSTLGRVSADMVGTIRTYFEQTQPECKFAFFQGAAGNMGKGTRWEKAPWYAKCKSFDRDGYSREFVRLLKEDMAFADVNTGAITVKNTKLTVNRKTGDQILDESWDLPLNTITFGDVAICTAPAELFSDSGLEIRKRSDYKMTFVSTCTNGNYGYLPIKASFAGDPEFKSFEVKVSKCQPGTAEKIVDQLSAMLKV